MWELPRPPIFPYTLRELPTSPISPYTPWELPTSPISPYTLWELPTSPLTYTLWEWEQYFFATIKVYVCKHASITDAPHRTQVNRHNIWIPGEYATLSI